MCYAPFCLSNHIWKWHASLSREEINIFIHRPQWLVPSKYCQSLLAFHQPNMILGKANESQQDWRFSCRLLVLYTFTRLVRFVFWFYYCVITDIKQSKVLHKLNINRKGMFFIRVIISLCFCAVCFCHVLYMLCDDSTEGAGLIIWKSNFPRSSTSVASNICWRQTSSLRK